MHDEEEDSDTNGTYLRKKPCDYVVIPAEAGIQS